VPIIVLLLFTTGLAAAEYSLETNISINLAQSVEGNGFSSTYRYVNMPDPLGNLEGAVGDGLSGMAAKHAAHGSGAIEDEFFILAYSYYYEEGETPIQGGLELEPVIDDDNTTAFSMVRIQADTSMIYSPSDMTLERGYYAHSPISWKSLPADRTFIKNFDTGSLLQNEIDHAQALRKELKAQADYIDLANTSMRFDETITDGKAEIRALKLEGLPTIRDVEVENGGGDGVDEGGGPEIVPILLIEKSKPLIEIDEVYIGNFHLNKSINLTASVSDDDEDDEWLPCCNQSIDEIKGKDVWYRGITGIFDCTC
jgi:hypothetical protein